MGMGGTEIPEMEGRFAPRGHLDHLVPSGMAAGMSHDDAETDFLVPFDEMQPSPVAEEVEILFQVGGLGAITGVAQVLPLGRLEDMRRPRKREFASAGGVDHLDAAGMIEIAVSQDERNRRPRG